MTSAVGVVGAVPSQTVLTSATLAEALRAAVRAQRFDQTSDALQAGAPRGVMPNLDLAVAAFPAGQPPCAANLLFSREHPQGLVAGIAPGFGAVRDVHWLADERDEQGVSRLWQPGSDWRDHRFTPAFDATAAAEPGTDPARRFVVPYPASLLKLMVALGVALSVDAGRCDWPARPMQDMLTVSSNEATTELVALLHRVDGIAALHGWLQTHDLTSLRLDGTRPDGGWGNAAGAGVGRIQMTAWDTVRLLWLLDEAAPAAPWLASPVALLSNESRRRLRALLEAQAQHHVLSSTLLAGVPGWTPGLPARLPAHWIAADGAAEVAGHRYPPELHAANAQARVRFAHKPGSTENYASDAGIVQGLHPARRHYLIALISTLGQRHAPTPLCAGPWSLPALGAAVDEWLARMLEPR